MVSFLVRLFQRTRKVPNLLAEFSHFLVRLFAHGFEVAFSFFKPVFQKPHVLQNPILLMNLLIKIVFQFVRLVSVNIVLDCQFLNSSLPFMYQLLSFVNLLIFWPYQWRELLNIYLHVLYFVFKSLNHVLLLIQQVLVFLHVSGVALELDSHFFILSVFLLFLLLQQ